MGFKEFFNKTIEQIKESNKPENVKKRLTQQIEIESLKAKRDRIANARRKEKYSKSWSVGESR